MEKAYKRTEYCFALLVPMLALCIVLIFIPAPDLELDTLSISCIPLCFKECFPFFYSIISNVIPVLAFSFITYLMEDFIIRHCFECDFYPFYACAVTCIKVDWSSEYVAVCRERVNPRPA